MVAVHKYMLVSLFFVSCALNASDDSSFSQKSSQNKLYTTQFISGASAAAVLTGLVGIGCVYTGDKDAMKAALTSYTGLAGQFFAGALVTRYFSEKINKGYSDTNLLKSWGYNAAGYSLTTAAILAYLKSGK